MKRTLTGALLCLFVNLSFCPPVHSGFSLGMSPVRWEARGKAGKTLRNVVVLTGGAGAIHDIKVRRVDWTLSDEGTPSYAEPGSLSMSAASWVRIHPDELSIYPRQRKTVRISIQIPPETPSGGYRAAIFFEPLKSEEKVQTGAASVFVRGRLGFHIYVTVGDARPRGEILEAAWRVTNGADPTPAVRVLNGGNAHLRMEGFFTAHTPSKERLEGVIPSLPVLPGQTRWIPLEFRGESPEPYSDLDLSLLVDLGEGERKVTVTLPGKSKS